MRRSLFRLLGLGAMTICPELQRLPSASSCACRSEHAHPGPALQDFEHEMQESPHGHPDLQVVQQPALEPQDITNTGVIRRKNAIASLSFVMGATCINGLRAKQHRQDVQCCAKASRQVTMARMRLTIISAVAMLAAGCFTMSDGNFERLPRDEQMRFNRCLVQTQTVRCGGRFANDFAAQDCVNKAKNEYSANDTKRNRKAWLLEMGCPPSMIEPEKYLSEEDDEPAARPMRKLKPVHHQGEVIQDTSTVDGSEYGPAPKATP